MKVERDEMVKGYEFAKDRYVTFTQDELKALDELATQTHRHRRVRAGRAGGPRLLRSRATTSDRTRAAAKAYRLLALALERAGKAALARYAARGKQYLVLIRPRDGRLVMQQLYHADEVRPPEEVPIDDAQPKDTEVQLALQLIEQTASDAFRPEQYEDAVKARVLAAIEKKVEGQEIQVAAPAEPAAQVIDLMDALKASIDAPRRRARRRARAARGARAAEPAERKAREAGTRAARTRRGKASSRK